VNITTAAATRRMRRTLSTGLAVFSLIGLTAGIASADRFVAIGGSDPTNDCINPALPCATIAFAVSQATAGEIVQVGAGSFAGSVAIDKPLTLRGAQAGVAVASRTAGGAGETIVDARGLPTAITVTSGDVVMEGLDVLGDASTSTGILLTGNSDLPNVVVRDNFVRGMALDDPALAPHFAYGIFALTGTPGTRNAISGLVVQGNDIAGLGASGSVAGAGMWLYNVVGGTPGAGATITGNSLRNLASRDATLNRGTGIVVDAGTDDLLGIPTSPSSGVSVSGNTYANATFGAVLFASSSSFGEPQAAFITVPGLVVDVGRLATIDTVALGRHVTSNAILGFVDSDGYFATIQGAADASQPAAELRPTPHVFMETPVLTRGVQLLGPRAGEDARTRDPLLGEATLPLGALIRAEGAIIDGMSISNPGGIAVLADATTTTATVRNCIVTTAVRGISLDRAQAAFVQQNLISDIDDIAIGAGSDNFTATIGDDVVSVAVVQDNEVVDAQVGIGGYLRQSTISRNLVRDHPGIELGAGIAGQFRDTLVERNVVSGYERGAGLLLTGVPNRPVTRDTVFKCNEFLDNYFGILVEPTQTTLTGLTIRSNTMTGNTIGILNYPSIPLDATLNWWGCAGGPGTAGCDPAGVNVTYTPFLTAAPDCVSCVTNEDCDDNVICNGSEVCDPTTSVCAPGTPPVCDTAPADPDCNFAVCQEIFGCIVTPIEDGSSCDVDPTCASDDVCIAGECVAGPGAGDEDEDGICDANDGCPFCGLPMDLEIVRLVRNTGNLRDNGKIVVKASFLAPIGSSEEFNASHPISVLVRDGGSLSVEAAFDLAECGQRRSIITCKSSDRRFNLRVKPFRPRDTTGKQIMNLTLRGLDIGPSFQGPVTVVVRHGDGITRSGAIASCVTAPGLLRCF
jgi:nitrous oxidase accessory protein NosD